MYVSLITRRICLYLTSIPSWFDRIRHFCFSDWNRLVSHDVTSSSRVRKVGQGCAYCTGLQGGPCRFHSLRRRGSVQPIDRVSSIHALLPPSFADALYCIDSSPQFLPSHKLVVKMRPRIPMPVIETTVSKMVYRIGVTPKRPLRFSFGLRSHSGQLPLS